MGVGGHLARSRAEMGFLREWDGGGTFASRLAERGFSVRVCEV